MNKTVVIHQPDFMPYLGFFHRLLYADLFVILDDVDDVQFLREGWHHRDKIKTYNGEKWHSLKIKKLPLDTPINQIILLENDKWVKENLNQIKENYRKSDFFDEIYPYIESLYNKKFKKMVDCNLASIDMLIKLFDIKKIDIDYSSKYDITTNANEMVVDILKKVGATHYLSGIGAKDYFRQEPFDEANIKVIWQDFKHPIYPQLYGEFIPYLSSIKNQEKY